MSQRHPEGLTETERKRWRERQRGMREISRKMRRKGTRDEEEDSRRKHTGGPAGVARHSLRISAVAYLGIMESVVSSGCRMQPCV